MRLGLVDPIHISALRHLQRFERETDSLVITGLGDQPFRLLELIGDTSF